MDFSELSGTLGHGPARPGDAGGRVVLSTLKAGAAESAAGACLGLKYVGAGTEVYRYGGATQTVSAGQFLIVPPGASGYVEIASRGQETLGLCVYLQQSAEHGALSLDAPMLFPARCSPLGTMLEAAHARMRRSSFDRREVAGKLSAHVRAGLEPLIAETLGQLDAMDGMRASTRYELLRRLNTARAYLHAVCDRPVELAELARVAGTSRFHLLRNFRDCFGAPPATYHRRLRLAQAKAEIAAGRLSCAQAATRFGFADASSFSHAYRRAFGHAPLRSAGPARDRPLES